MLFGWLEANDTQHRLQLMGQYNWHLYSPNGFRNISRLVYRFYCQCIWVSQLPGRMPSIGYIHFVFGILFAYFAPLTLSLKLKINSIAISKTLSMTSHATHERNHSCRDSQLKTQRRKLYAFISTHPHPHSTCTTFRLRFSNRCESYWHVQLDECYYFQAMHKRIR